MGSNAVLVVLLLFSVMIFQNEVEAGSYNISTEDDLEWEKQLKILNKPAIKTILTDYGDIYDCVDFYKQPAFDHPLLKDYKVDFQKLKGSIFRRKPRDRVSYNESEYVNMELKDEGCPEGTVPIRRITKEDLIREKLAMDVRSLGLNNSNTPRIHYAVCRVKNKIAPRFYFDGSGGGASVWNPKVQGKQSSAAKMKIQNGAESIEVGWRVDPTLYGDTKTRFFIRTDAGLTHCFDTRCPGFIVVDKSIPLGIPVQYSKRGGPIKALPLFFKRDNINGNWFLTILENRTIGYWPGKLFTGLSHYATYVEWGGEVFGPAGQPKPAMGAGYIPTRPNTNYDAFFRKLELVIALGTYDVTNLEAHWDNKNYKSVDGWTDHDPHWRHLMFYGGSASPN